MEGAKTSVGYIFNVLLSRSMKGTKSSVDADYRTVLDTLMTDLLIVLGHPEWPSAELYILIFSKAMVNIKANILSRCITKSCLWCAVYLS
jgi:cohesin loading factor subunit SCC2